MDGVERVMKDGHYFDYDLPSEIRKFTMFKGESDLDVFQTSNALKLLIETFSDVKDFEAYFKFMGSMQQRRQIKHSRMHRERTGKTNRRFSPPMPKLCACKPTYMK